MAQTKRQRRGCCYNPKETWIRTKLMELELKVRGLTVLGCGVFSTLQEISKGVREA